MTNLELIFPYDYIIILIILLIIFFSFWKGLIQSILGLLTWVGSILITIYSYDTLAVFVTKQMMKIKIFQNYEYLTNIASIIIVIPTIFLISLFLLKRIRNFLSADLDRKILGIIFDKLFGAIYGIVFSYVILSAFIIILEKFNIYDFNDWLIINSNIINSINLLNNEYFFIVDMYEINND